MKQDLLAATDRCRVHNVPVIRPHEVRGTVLFFPAFLTHRQQYGYQYFIQFCSLRLQSAYMWLQSAPGLRLGCAIAHITPSQLPTVYGPVIIRASNVPQLIFCLLCLSFASRLHSSPTGYCSRSLIFTFHTFFD